MNNSICLIIPTFNRSHLIQKAINSIYYQGFDEIIVIDDGSSDFHIKKIEELLQQYPRIKFLKNNYNLGLPRTRNRAIIQCKSNWIIFLDDDDFHISPENNWGKKLKNFILEHPEADIITHRLINIDSFNLDMHYYGKEKFTLEELRENNCLPGTCLFKKEIWINIGGHKNISHSDWEFWIRAKEKNYNFLFFPESFYCRIEHSDGLQNITKKNLDYDEWRKKYTNKNKKLIIQLATVPCANCGYELSKLINAYSNNYTSVYILGKEYNDSPVAPFRKFPHEFYWQTQKNECIELIKKADIIHAHHGFYFEEIEPLLKNKIVITTLYDIHSSYNETYLNQVKKYSTFLTVADQPLQKEIYKKLSTYTLPIIRFLFEESTIKDNPVPLIVFAPTIKNLGNRMPLCSKKREEVIEILEKLKKDSTLKFEIDLIEGQPLDENLNRKRKADIIIDDMNNNFEEFHCTSLEATCFGAIPLTSYSGEDYPFIKTNIETLESTLYFYINNPKELKKAQQKIINWRKTFYTPEKLLFLYETLYQNLLENKAKTNPKIIIDNNEKIESLFNILNKNKLYYWVAKETLLYIIQKKEITEPLLNLGTNNEINKNIILDLLKNTDFKIEIEINRSQHIKNYNYKNIIITVPKPLILYLRKYTKKSWEQIINDKKYKNKEWLKK